MKIRIEVQPELGESEVLIRCAQVDEGVRALQQYILDQSSGAQGIVFYKENQEFYFPLSEVLFFETEGDMVYAHTAGESYRIRHRLYELEGILPSSFVRVSKSTILNADNIRAVTRNLASSSLVEFPDTHKHVYVSRRYYDMLKDRLQKRSYR